MKKYGTIGEYIALFPKDTAEKLNAIRKLISETAPKAKEAIKYGIPTFTLNGNLVHFAAYRNHIGFYPAPSGIKHFEKELAGYQMAKGSVQFPNSKPLPLQLIRRIVEFRVRENSG